MKFSVIFEAQLADPTVEREHQVIRDCVEQAVLAEQMGFDRIWAVEHHSLKWYAHMKKATREPLRPAIHPAFQWSVGNNWESILWAASQCAF